MITIRKIWVLLFISIIWNFVFYSIAYTLQGEGASIIRKNDISTIEHSLKVQKLPSEAPTSQVLAEVLEEIQEEEPKSFITPSKLKEFHCLNYLTSPNFYGKYLSVPQRKRYILFCSLKIPC